MLCKAKSHSQVICSPRLSHVLPLPTGFGSLGQNNNFVEGREKDVKKLFHGWEKSLWCQDIGGLFVLLLRSSLKVAVVCPPFLLHYFILLLYFPMSCFSFSFFWFFHKANGGGSFLFNSFIGLYLTYNSLHIF